MTMLPYSNFIPRFLTNPNNLCVNVFHNNARPNLKMYHNASTNYSCNIYLYHYMYFVILSTLSQHNY